MADGKRTARGPVGAPPWQRGRRRWGAISGGVVGCWLLAYLMTGSMAAAIVVLVAVIALAVLAAAGLRALGITREHPLVQRMFTRPWRNGRRVLDVAVRHMPEVLVVTPSGSLIAPDIVELQMNPADFASLRQWMEPSVVNESMTEAYVSQVAKSGARFAGTAEPEVYIVPDDSVPQGRFHLRRGLPAGSRPSIDYQDLPEPDYRDRPDEPDYGDHAFTEGFQPFAYAAAAAAAAPDRARPAERARNEAGLAERAQNAARPADHTRYDAGPAGRKRPEAVPADRTRYEVNMDRTVMDGLDTVMEQIRPAVPVLRLVTGSLVAETTVSGARAGRGPVELELPDVPTVSRVHATFTFGSGCWWVANEGVNGLSLNGVQVSGKQALSDGDSIRWGKRSDAPLSRVEIG